MFSTKTIAALLLHQNVPNIARFQQAIILPFMDNHLF